MRSLCMKCMVVVSVIANYKLKWESKSKTKIRGKISSRELETNESEAKLMMIFIISLRNVFYFIHSFIRSSIHPILFFTHTHSHILFCRINASLCQIDQTEMYFNAVNSIRCVLQNGFRCISTHNVCSFLHADSSLVVLLLLLPPSSSLPSSLFLSL